MQAGIFIGEELKRGVGRSGGATDPGRCGGKGELRWGSGGEDLRQSDMAATSRTLDGAAAEEF